VTFLFIFKKITHVASMYVPRMHWLDQNWVRG